MKNSNILKWILLILLYMNSEAQTPAFNYKVEHRFTVTGNGGWDYYCVDSKTNKLFLSHGQLTQVLNSKTGIA